MNENDAASPEHSEIIEVVQQQIKDPTIEVGSGCVWRGSEVTKVNNTQKFEFRIEELCLEKYAAPPEDPLGELSEFEMGIRRFCFESNYEVLIQIGSERKRVFFDPDICMLLDHDLPKQVLALSQGKKIELDFPESYFSIKFVPVDSKISCTLQEFGYSIKQKHFEFDKTQVLEVLRRFLDEVIDKAVDGGYITSEKKEQFLQPMRQQAMC